MPNKTNQKYFHNPSNYGNTHKGYGVTALCVLSLIKANGSDTLISGGLNYLRDGYDKDPSPYTYDNALLLMVMEAYYRKRKKPRKISLKDKTLIYAAVTRLLEIGKDGYWGYEKDRGGDLSTTQYAVLGLHYASRMGRDVVQILDKNQDLWNRVYEKIKAMKIEKSDNTIAWPYSGGSGAKATMTAGGICIAMIAWMQLKRSGKLTPKISEEINEMVQKAALYLNRQLSIENFISGLEYPYYFLYALERAAGLSQSESFSSISWYEKGTAFLNKKLEKETNPVKAAFALLFLTRPTLSPDKHFRMFGGFQNGLPVTVTFAEDLESKLKDLKDLMIFVNGHYVKKSKKGEMVANFSTPGKK